MLGNISFIGGIHGVGKSTICTAICESTGRLHLSASELIKWKDINTDVFNKKVASIPDTQDRLINGLQGVTQQGKHYLLDGHYCLFDGQGRITPVPIETFTSIQPVSLHIILGDTLEIKKRLEARDAKTYDAELLDQMQRCEMDHARRVASSLHVELSVGTFSDYSKIVSSIKRLHQL